MEPFDLPGALRRIRREGDLSQRELAEGCGLSQSAVAQAETGRRDLPVTALARAATLARLRLALLDGDGLEVPPMSGGSVRDLGRRRYPAHLDTRRTAAGISFHEQRRDRPETGYTFTRDRPARDARRDARGTPTDHHPWLPGDTPAERRAARRAEAAQRRREELERRRVAGELPPLTDFTCTCPPDCADGDDGQRPFHTEECPCRCDVD
ncbi:helix-turn-helix transcriptional regulator [Blastococcus sp. BMG 814]|uniref:Helix-turn-helix transcriptional regulator n=1 Tax=Blastococcus carthaginiensis TaxID=3050034 RepID=A0ABT9IEX7_9ACTN|nr:helix-turn-helix transcriptional regulator [Blastococcus carthaginiensis]MDP5184113.1 helix-turn-helix transcriptional regulator [Blastococcus carthaginiensis]